MKKKEILAEIDNWIRIDRANYEFLQRVMDQVDCETYDAHIVFLQASLNKCEGHIEALQRCRRLILRTTNG